MVLISYYLYLLWLSHHFHSNQLIQLMIFNIILSSLLLLNCNHQIIKMNQQFKLNYFINSFYCLNFHNSLYSLFFYLSLKQNQYIFLKLAEIKIYLYCSLKLFQNYLFDHSLNLKIWLIYFFDHFLQSLKHLNFIWLELYYMNKTVFPY